jgi:hypothetical protein
MTRFRSFLTISLAVGGVAATTGAVYAATVDGPAASATQNLESQRPLSGDTLGVLNTSPATPTRAEDAQRLNSSGAVADYRLNLGAARVIEANGSRWSLTVGDRGACAVVEARSVFCATTQTIQSGGALAFSFNTADAPALSERGSAGLKPASKASGTVRGIVSNAVDHVTVSDENGSAVGRAPVSSNVYEVEVSDFSQAKTVELRSGSGETLSRKKLPF